MMARTQRGADRERSTPRFVLRALRAARAAGPAEACGVLVGPAPGRPRATRRLPNRAAAPDRFELDGLALLRIERRLRNAGLAVVGYFHSHPRGDVRPSRRDRAAECWPGRGPALRLIVSPPGRWALYRVTPAGWHRLAGGDSATPELPA